MEQIECVVIGAGVVGLACAAAIARAGREVLVLEREQCIGLHASSRNSEVIHAGIYYPPGSLKAELCRRGKEQLYRFADERGIPHRRLGKLVVATSTGQIAQLEHLKANAEANDVTDLRFLLTKDVERIEPQISCTAALLSPSTGIIDSHALMLALEGELETHGGMVVLGTPVTEASITDSGIVIHAGGTDPMRMHTRYLINCAGLFAPSVSRTIDGLDQRTIPQEYFALGHYYRLGCPAPCERLVYPLPEDGGLGIHLTLDLGGQARFGPDVRWIDNVDYRFIDDREDRFLAAIQHYLPHICKKDLSPDYTGIRSKITGPSEGAEDFRIEKHAAGTGGAVLGLYGIESPGLTSSLAIAEHVVDLMG